jgi:hypothetical protein
MKAGFAILLFLMTGIGGFAQKDYFIYIQADNNQPFYVLMDGKTFSSTDHGYIILSGLQAQAYQFVIGFPKNAFPEQNFILNVYNKDAGYQLKNFGIKGWGLSNYQTEEATMNRNSETNTSMLSGTRKTDNFSVLLSNVVNDTSILYDRAAPQTAVAQTTTAPAQTVAAAAKQPDPAAIAATQAAVTTAASDAGSKAPAIEKANIEGQHLVDSAKHVVDSAAKNEAIAAVPVASLQSDTLATEKKTLQDTAAIVNVPVKTDSIMAIIPAKPALSFVKKISESTSEIALEEIFIDSSGSGIDTIRIATPLTKETAIQTPPPPAAVAVIATEPAKVDSTVKKETPDTTTTISKPVASSVQINNSDCKNTATDSDIDKLRVKLLSMNDLDEKIATTKKLLKSKCFMVKQLKAISELFAEDESKYQLFETAYPFTLDTYNYATLEELIKSDYYRNRFNAMLRR